MNLAVRGVKLAKAGILSQMAPAKVDAVVAVGKTPEVAVEEHTLGALPGTFEAPPFSASIYSFPVQ
jgi:hypothetical protein